MSTEPHPCPLCGAPRLPFEPLAEAARAETRTGLARALGILPRQLYRLMQRGLYPAQADEFAARLGLHPAEVWPAEW